MDEITGPGTGPSPAAARVLAAIGGSNVMDRLVELSGSDFTSLMLEVARRRAAVAEQVRAIAAGLAAAGLAPVQLALTPLSAAGESIALALAADLAGPLMEVIGDSQRQAGRGYYRELCYRISVQAGAQWRELADGGFTDWAARLTASSKERLLISGLGIDRLAAMMPR